MTLTDLTASRRAGTIVFGIVNVTPDSFSDGGAHDDVRSAVAFGTRLIDEGADVLDVGGESTRPGATAVPVEEEQRRVLPVVRELVTRGFTVSVDTMHASTAAKSVEWGATVVNDVTGGADPDMAAVVADLEVLYVAMHSRIPGVGGTRLADYVDAVSEVSGELARRVADLVEHGVDPARIVIDPGLGFSKTADHNWQLLAGLTELAALGLPILVGASRKRFLGDLLPTGADGTGADPTGAYVAGRDTATAVVSALAADAGAWGVRVHDVARTRLALDVWSAWDGARRAAR